MFRGRCRCHEVAVKLLKKQDYTLEEVRTFRHEAQVKSTFFIAQLDHPKIYYSTTARSPLWSLKEISDSILSGVLMFMVLVYTIKSINCSLIMPSSQMMSKCRHPNIVLFMGACLVKPSFAIVTEVCYVISVSVLSNE